MSPKKTVPATRNGLSADEISLVRQEGAAMFGLSRNHVTILANVLKRGGQFYVHELSDGTWWGGRPKRLTPRGILNALDLLFERDLLVSVVRGNHFRGIPWKADPGPRLLEWLNYRFRRSISA